MLCLTVYIIFLVIFFPSHVSVSYHGLNVKIIPKKVVRVVGFPKGPNGCKPFKFYCVRFPLLVIKGATKQSGVCIVEVVHPGVLLSMFNFFVGGIYFAGMTRSIYSILAENKASRQ